MMREWIKLDLGPALQRAGYGKDKIKLMMLDDNTDMLEYFAGTVLSNHEADRYVDGIAIHWYQNNRVGYGGIKRTREKFPKKFILSTEACEGFLHDSPKGVLIFSKTDAS